MIGCIGQGLSHRQRVLRTPTFLKYRDASLMSALTDISNIQRPIVISSMSDLAKYKMTLALNCQPCHRWVEIIPQEWLDAGKPDIDYVERLWQLRPDAADPARPNAAGVSPPPLFLNLEKPCPLFVDRDHVDRRRPSGRDKYPVFEAQEMLTAIPEIV
jgi:hypothetical protein